MRRPSPAGATAVCGPVPKAIRFTRPNFQEDRESQQAEYRLTLKMDYLVADMARRVSMDGVPGCAAWSASAYELCMTARALRDSKSGAFVDNDLVRKFYADLVERLARPWTASARFAGKASLCYIDRSRKTGRSKYTIHASKRCIPVKACRAMNDLPVSQIGKMCSLCCLFEMDKKTRRATWISNANAMFSEMRESWNDVKDEDRFAKVLAYAILLWQMAASWIA
eukprot:jgi/Tetstr1/465028/TSEL_009756.t1